MELKILGSSSKGNGYILRGTTSSLILETGFKLKKAKEMLGFDLKSVEGVLVTHSHGDHSRYIWEYLRAGLNCYMTEQTATELRVLKHYRTNIINVEEPFNVGFKVMAFNTEHDCEGSVGYYINHEEMGNLVFATDTYFLRYTFDDLDYIMIEANYKKEILKENFQTGVIHELQVKRVLRSHFEIMNTIKWIKLNDLSNVKKIILLHLSDQNSNAKLFKRLVEEETNINTEIAEKGKTIQLLDDEEIKEKKTKK
jgi:phosphoribosyl 1,2-cyclic phosphodiesterase